MKDQLLTIHLSADYTCPKGYDYEHKDETVHRSVIFHHFDISIHFGGKKKEVELKSRKGMNPKNAWDDVHNKLVKYLNKHPKLKGTYAFMHSSSIDHFFMDQDDWFEYNGEVSDKSFTDQYAYPFVREHRTNSSIEVCVFRLTRKEKGWKPTWDDVKHLAPIGYRKKGWGNFKKPILDVDNIPYWIKNKGEVQLFEFGFTYGDEFLSVLNTKWHGVHEVKS